MIINGDDLRQKVNLLGMAISKNVASKQSERMIRFEYDNGIVYGYTYDGVNNIRVEIGPNDKDFYAIVEYNTFATFIKSCEGDITLEPDKKFLQVKSSNVKCKLPIYNHEVSRGKTGILDPTDNYTYTKSLTESIDVNVLKSVIDTTHVVDVYEKVYFGNNIMVSDTDNVLIIKKKIFDEDILLDFNSVLILNAISNINYDIISRDNIKLLVVKSDELYATMTITENTDNDFQYDDFMDLFESITDNDVVIDTSILSKAMSAASMFKSTPKLVFNQKGIFLRLDSVEFIYKISDTICQDKAFILTNDVVKKITTIGKDVNVFYTYDDMIKCDCDNRSEILSIQEVTDNG